MAISVVPVPFQLPGECLVCRGTSVSPGRTFFLDLGFSLDFHGRLYICNMCLDEGAREVGYLSPEAADVLKKKAEEDGQKVYELSLRSDGLQRALDDLLRGGFQHSSAFVSGMERMESNNVAARKPSKGKETVGNGAAETSGPLHDEGMGELPADADSEDSEFSIGF